MRSRVTALFALSIAALLTPGTARADHVLYQGTLSGNGYSDIDYEVKFRCVLTGDTPTSVVYTLTVTNNDDISHDLDLTIHIDQGGDMTNSVNSAAGQTDKVVRTIDLPTVVTPSVTIDGDWRGIADTVLNDTIVAGSIAANCQGDALIPDTGAATFPLVLTAGGVLLLGAGATLMSRRRFA